MTNQYLPLYFSRVLLLFSCTLIFNCSSAMAANPLNFSVTVTSPVNTPEAVVDVVLETICPEIISGSESQPSNLLQVCNFISNATPAEVAAVVEELSPKSNTASNTLVSKTPSMSNSRGVGLRLTALRSSARNKNQYAYRAKNQKKTSFSSMVFNQQNPDDQGSLLSQRLSGFININSISAEQLESSTEIGYDSTSRGLLFGVDYRLLNRTYIGIASQYFITAADLSDSGSKLDASQIGIILYGTHFINKHWYLEATLNTSRQQLEIKRQIDLSLGVNAIAMGETSSNQRGISFGTGYDIPLQFGLNSLASVNVSYTSNSISAYAEENAGNLGLEIDSQSISSLTITSNVYLSRVFSTSLGVIIPQLSGAWIHETKQEAQAIGSRFVNDKSNTKFVFNTPKADPNYFVLGLDLQMVLPQGRMIFLKYSNVRQLRDKIEYSLITGFRMEF